MRAWSLIWTGQASHKIKADRTWDTQLVPCASPDGHALKSLEVGLWSIPRLLAPCFIAPPPWNLHVDLRLLYLMVLCEQCVVNSK